MNRCFYILAGLFFICCGFVTKPAADIAIIYIGDSITYGAGLPQKDTQAPAAVVSQLIQQKTHTNVLFANQGKSGFTTLDFLPTPNNVPDNAPNNAPNNKYWKQILEAAKSLQKENRLLIFSIMLGTNDSAEEGPKGSPVSAATYHKNLQIITDSLLAVFPEGKIIIHQPVWYSDNTYNRSKYLAAGLERLQSYFPEIRAMVKENAKLHPGRVFRGDRDAFKIFKNKSKELMQAENGQQGVFYLHPNQKGAAVLAACWAKSIEKVLH